MKSNLNQTQIRNIAISSPSIGEEEYAAMREPIETGWIAQGPKVNEFETLVAAYVGTKYAVACSSGTAALHLMLAGLNLSPGDEVIVPAYSWVSTANAVLYCGAKPIFVDVDPSTHNILPDQIKKVITSKTKAVMIVHSFGYCCDMDQLREVTKEIPILEDAACAFGAVFGSKRAGNLGHAAAFSFHPRKIITTGEGGIVTTNDEALANQIRSLRNHGGTASNSSDRQDFDLPEFHQLGFNYRLTDLQAAIGIVQIGKIEKILSDRVSWTKTYCNQLASVDGIEIPIDLLKTGNRHCWQSFIIRMKSTDPKTKRNLMKKLQEKGVATRTGTTAITTLDYYRNHHGIKPENYPGALAADNQSISIPFHGGMNEDDFEYVSNAIISSL